MLQIAVNDNYIDITEDISITIIKKSPIFFQYDGSFAYNFKLPRTNRNNRIFESPKLLCSIQFSGESILNGIMLVKFIYEEYFEVSCGFDKGFVNNKAQNTSLSSDIYTYTEQIPFGETPFAFYKSKFLSGIYANAIYPAIPYQVFPFINDNYFEGDAFQEQSICISTDSDPSDFETYIGNIVNYMKKDGATDYQYNKHHNSNRRLPFNPSFFVTYIIEEIANHFGFVMKRNFISEDDELRRLVVLHNADYTANNNGALFSYELKPGRYLPDITVMEFLNNIAAYFCGWVFVKGNEISILKFDDIFSDDSYVEFSENIISFYEIIEPIQNYTIDVNQDDKDAFKSEQIEQIKNMRVKGIVATESDLNLINAADELGVYYVEDLSGYIYRTFANGVYLNTFLRLPIFDYNIGIGVAENTKISNTVVTPSTTSLGNGGAEDLILSKVYGKAAFWYIPIMKVQADYVNSTGNYIKSDDTNIRLLFYRGIQTDIGGFSYPFASYDVFKAKFSVVAGANYSLDLYGNRGRYNNFFKKYLYWLMNICRSFKMQKYLSPVEYNSIDFALKYRINGAKYVLKSIETTLTYNKIGISEIELAKI
ncbi:MAG: hypothetical protein WCK02_02135 [Bacteroidota bacterium]